MTNDQTDRRQKKLYTHIQAHFVPKLKIREKLDGVIQLKDRTIVYCPDEVGKIVLPPVIESKIKFGGEQIQKPEYFLFSSEAGGPKPVWSAYVSDQITGWARGFSRIICGLEGERLFGYVPLERVKPRGHKVLFRAKELCRIDVHYSRDGRHAYLTISQHQITGEENGEPSYEMEIIFQTRIIFNSEISYIKALEQTLINEGLERFRVPATIAVEMGYIFPNNVGPKSSLIKNFSNIQRAIKPVYFKFKDKESEEEVRTANI